MPTETVGILCKKEMNYMKKKRMVAILVVVSLISVFAGAAAGSLITEIRAELRHDFRIVIDGEEKTFKNVNGEKVYPILYDGTTYLPIRAVGEMMGKTVYWYEDDKLIEFKDNSSTVTDADVIVKSKDEAKTPVPSELIGEEKAKEKALADAGLKAENVKFIRAELDNDDGVWHYDVEFIKGNTEYDYDIKADDGKILGKDIDTEPAKENKENNPYAVTPVITGEQAKKIALDKAGVSERDAKLLKVELDKDDGILKYEVEFKTGNKEFEADINALTGEIIKWDAEIDD